MSKRSNIMTEGEPVFKKPKPVITLDIHDDEFKAFFHEYWFANTPLESTALEVIISPFRVCKIPNFITNETFIEDLKNELSMVKSTRRWEKLGCYEDTGDITGRSSGPIHGLHQVLKDRVRPLFQADPSISLGPLISMYSSCYTDTDYFLCHNDYGDDRRIAYVLYLSENWTQEDGGTLDLFDTDSQQRPRNIVHSIIPEYNSLLLFEVTKTSYHQVAEVISPDKSRWNIYGWFHSPEKRAILSPRPAVELMYHQPSESDEELTSSIMDCCYLSKNIVIGIQEDLDKKSSTHLAHFLKEEVYKKITTELMSKEIRWERVGPADRRNYEVAVELTLPCTLKKFYKMFQSIEFVKLLKKFSELDLIPDGNTMKPKMVIELQRWSQGCYTLIYEPGKAKQNCGAIYNAIEKPKMIICESEKKSVGSDESFGELKKNRTKNSEVLKEITHANEIYPSSSDNSGKENKTNRGILDPEDDPLKSLLRYTNTLYTTTCGADSENPDLSFDSTTEPGTLDVIMQFHMTHGSKDKTVDYVDPKDQDTAIISVPSEDNNLSLIRKTPNIHRLQRYVNHYHEGYFYNLICTYYE